MSELVSMRVDADRCIGGGQCELLAPDTFRIDDDTAIAVVLGGGLVRLDVAEDLVDRCPSGALSHGLASTDGPAAEA